MLYRAVPKLYQFRDTNLSRNAVRGTIGLFFLVELDCIFAFRVK